MASSSSPRTYSERLLPSIPFFFALLLIVPAMFILFMPFGAGVLGWLYGAIAFVLVSSIFIVASKTLSVEGNTLVAGRAQIAAEHIGDMTELDADELRVAIGRRLDARAYLVVNGWIHRGLKLEITDPEDPTPYWVITTRRPAELRAALENARLNRGE